jgi:malonyl-CoA O-methyltransferase
VAMEALPFADEAFQGVFSSLALQWVDDPLAAFKQMARVLEPGGVMVVTTFTEGTLKELRAASDIAQMGPTVLSMRTQAEYKALAREADLSLLEVRGRKEQHWMPHVRALLKHLRTLGATNQLKERSRHVTSAAKFKRMMDAYHYHFGGAQGIPVTWETLLLVLRKPHI